MSTTPQTPPSCSPPACSPPACSPPACSPPACCPPACCPPACCIVFTTDLGYLFPTLVAAMQARRHASVAKADVLICHFGLDAAAERLFADICAREGIGLLAVDPATIEHATPMMSRLFLDRFLPAGYGQMLYLDGDVQIARSLDPLIEADVAPGQFLAVNDPTTFLLADGDAQSRDLAAHMAAIGLTPEQAGRYFNTGVLRINRDGWAAIGQRAWALAQGGPASRFPDQDPLNLVATECHAPLSLAWNFPIFMRHARVEAAIDPCITHFMSNPKPWQGAYPPWDARACGPYDDAVAAYPALAAYRQALPWRRRVKYRLLQTAKKLVERRSWGDSPRRGRILEYEGRALLGGVR